ncbi:MAG: hypothetical protein WCH01_14300 [Methylococcaceae bacterium]
MGKITGSPPDAGVSPRDRSLPAGVRSTENKATENNAVDSKPNTIKAKGLWLYSGDPRIGLYHENSPDWIVRSISTLASDNRNGFASLTEAAKEYYTASGKRIPKLAILVHGDFGGVVYIENQKKNIPDSERNNQNYMFMSPYTIFYFKKEIEELNKYLTEDAQIIFYSCRAGAGSEGGYFLKEMSRYLPNKTVIGFSTLGQSGVSGTNPPTLPKPAGMVFETGESYLEPNKQYKNIGLRDITSKYAKHAKNGNIVKSAQLPPTELNLELFTPKRYLDKKKNFFDVLMAAGPQLYYLGILLVGWQKLETMARDTLVDDTRKCMDIIENDEQYKKSRDQGLPKPKEPPKDGVLLVYRADVPISSRKLNEKQIEQYKALKRTLARDGQNYIPFIWTNLSKEKTFAIIDAMLIFSRVLKVRKSIQSLRAIIGEMDFRQIFKRL